MASLDTGSQIQKHAMNVADELKKEVTTTSRTAQEAFTSLAWLWPLRGLLYTVIHPEIIFSVRGALLKSLGSSSVVFGVLALFTYIPQAGLLSLVAGPLGPILALFVLGAESIFVLTFFAKPLFLEPALQQVFDATLLAQGQNVLVKNGKARFSATTGRASALLRPLHALSRDGVVRYILTLALNLIPVLGTVMFLVINGDRAGPGWHERYFQLKAFDGARRKAFVAKHKAEYTAFGIAGLALTFIPVIGLVFTFTTMVGAALWAADMEARSNIIEGPSDTPTVDTAKTK